MPNAIHAAAPFEVAVAAVEAWLDGAGSSFAIRNNNQTLSLDAASWDFELLHPVLGYQLIRLSIPKDFPATPPQIYLNKELCLVLPHVESDGRLCHDVISSPDDYERPNQAVVEVLKSLQRFWDDSSDSEWVAKEFQKERLSYWLRFCDKIKTVEKVPAPVAVRAELRPLDRVTEGALSAFFKNSQRAKSELIVVTVGDVDPHALASRHGWADKTHVRGFSLFVPIDDNESWGPANWPTTLNELEAFVAQVTDNTQSVLQWIRSKQDGHRHIYLVVLVQSGVCYGYLISPAVVLGLTLPGVIPVEIKRVDENWALARDHELDRLINRRGKKVLILGCGSLGSPVIELLARSGVGELHLLDSQRFEPENCARHILGARDIGNLKAHALSQRLQEQIPGILVEPHWGLASKWIHENCKPGAYDLVIDCTGESSIRVMLSQIRNLSLGQCPIVHAWVEPFCAATHVVHIPHDSDWMLNDPTAKLAAAIWPDDIEVKLPACSEGFHPYGSADVWQSAGFATEKILALLDGQKSDALAWSSIRSQSFFDDLSIDVITNPVVISSDSRYDSFQITRFLKDIATNEK